MDKTRFYVDNMTAVDFLNEKKLIVGKSGFNKPSNKTWKEIIELMSEFYDRIEDSRSDYADGYVD